MARHAGLYLHIPFCKRKCGYCDFYSIIDDSLYHDFTNALIREIQIRSPDLKKFIFDTVYVGGGTPTVLPAANLKDIVRTIRDHLALDPSAEISIEANPGTIDRDMPATLAGLGFNRLSMGAQSFNNRDLHFLERIHTAEEIPENMQAARQAGFQNINIDLMTAFPGLSPEVFEESLEQAISLHSEHISCYTLIFEPGTPFYSRLKQGKLKALSADQEADYYELANQKLSDAGYQAYEISNYASDPEFMCRHNLKYWNHEPYIGLGPSAHSFIPPERWHNMRNIRKYMKELDQNHLPVVKREILDIRTLEFEYIFLHLRLREGINLQDFKKRFQKNFTMVYSEQLHPYFDVGMIENTGDSVRLTSSGWLLADEISSAFIL